MLINTARCFHKIHRSRGQNTEPRNKPTPIWSIYDKEVIPYNRENWANMWKKNETRPLYVIYNNKLKMDYISVRLKTTKLLEEIIGSKISDISLSTIVF